MSPAARRRRLAAAEANLTTSLAALDAVAADFRDAPGPTSVEDSATWRAVLDAAASTERARNTIHDLLNPPT